jgi:hypothetical protein
MDGKMKTGIKMRVTPEQSRKVQEIVVANGGCWLDGTTMEQYTDVPYLYIKNGWITYGYENDTFCEDKNIEVDPELFIRTNGTCELPERDENGQIRGLWITDVPLTEEAFTKARRIVGYKDPSRNSDCFIMEGDNWLTDDGSKGCDNWYYSWSNPESYNYKAKLTYQEFLDYYDTDAKEEFPPLEDIELYCGAVNLLALHFDSPEQEYEVYKAAYQDGANITWQLKQKEPHAELRKEFEEARESGEVVRVMLDVSDGLWVSIDEPKWVAKHDYKLVYYKFNPTKALAWSYRKGGVFISCEMEDLNGATWKGIWLESWSETARPLAPREMKYETCRPNIDKEGNVNLSNGTTVNIYTDGLIDEWFEQ